MLFGQLGDNLRQRRPAIRRNLGRIALPTEDIKPPLRDLGQVANGLHDKRLDQDEAVPGVPKNMVVQLGRGPMGFILQHALEQPKRLATHLIQEQQ